MLWRAQRCRASRVVEVARAAEGSLTEGFEVLDSCHKSVCSVKRVWLSSTKIARLSRTDSAVLRVAWSGDCWLYEGKKEERRLRSLVGFLARMCFC
jgi:hypothetical protein